MKKQKKQLLILLVVLILFVVGYIISIYKVDNVEVLDTVNVISVIKTDTESVKNISYIHDGVTMSFTKDSNGVWKLDGDDSFIPDADIVADIVSYASNLNARSEIENPSDPSEYGLDKPQYIVSFTDAAGVQQTYFIGDQFAVDGTYFAMVEGSDKIYTITEYYVNAFITDKEQLKGQSE